MKTQVVFSRGRISLVIDEPDRTAAQRDVVAAMTLDEGTPCWRLVDIRLSRYRNPTPFAGGLNADDVHAFHVPKTAEEAAFVRSLLREFRVDADGSINWCTFDGIARGQPTINGYAPATWANFDQAGYFSRAEGLAKLAEFKTFWDTYTGDRNKARIDNPHRQITMSELAFEVTLWSYAAAERQRRIGALPALKEAAGPAYKFHLLANEAIQAARDASEVNWRAVEDACMQYSIRNDGLPVERLYEVLCEHSPGTAAPHTHERLKLRIVDAMTSIHGIGRSAEAASTSLTNG